MRIRFASFLLAGLFLTALGARAQSSATLTGTVSDPSGAAIADAEITAQPLAGTSGSRTRVTSGPDGRFALEVPPGRYRLRVAAGSFARVEREFTLAAGETREWNMRAELERLAATVIVTGQAEPRVAEQVSAAVTVVTREEFDQRQAAWLGPILAATPGISVSRLGRDGGVTSVFSNGGNSNFTKVLIDGTTANEPGGAIDLSTFTLENVEKVEVVRGAESALHGSDAMAGVVQVFTRRGTTRRPVVELLGEGGKFSTARGSLHAGGTGGPFDYSGGVAYYHTEGRGANDRFRNTTLSGNFGWRASETSQLRLSLRSASSDAGVPGQTLFTPPNLDQHNGLRNFVAHLSWEFQGAARWRHRTAGSEAYIRQLFDNPTSDFCFSTPPFICDFAFTVRNLLNRAGFSHQTSYFGERGGITLGYQFEVENAFLGALHARRNNQAGYFEARLQPWRRLTVQFGARAEANDSFGTRVLPRIGSAYALRYGRGFWGATRVRGSFGLGIKEPTMFQSFAQDPCFPGNPGLRPERSRAVNAGVEQLLASDHARVSVDWFDNRFRDIVSFTFCFPGGPCPIAPPPGCPFGSGSFFNTDLARARGINLAIEARLAGWLRLSGNYSFVDSRVLQGPNAFDPVLVPGNRLLKRPVHSGNLVVNASFRRMNWNLAGYFVGPRTDSDFLGLGLSRNPGYARVDLAASYHLGRGVTAFGRIENLLDKEYQDSLGYPSLDRSYRLGMRFRLGGD